MEHLKVSPDGRFCITPDGKQSAFDIDVGGCWREPTLPEMEEIASQMTWVPVPIAGT